MRLILFSDAIQDKHKDKLLTFINQDLKNIKAVFLTTPYNYKKKKSDWFYQHIKSWKRIFPKIELFDLESTYNNNPNFNFKRYWSDIDFVFVSGGNTFLLSYWMDRTGSRKILRDLILEDRIIYSGSSAGAIYPYKDLRYYDLADDPSVAPSRVDKGLGIIEFALIPHWGRDEYDQVLKEINSLLKKEGVKTFPLTDDEALFINNKQIEKV